MATIRTHTKPKKTLEMRSLALIYSLDSIPTLANRWKELESEGWKLFVVDHNRGMCHYIKRWITIPLWVLSKPLGQWIQYVAHEFAHVPEWTRKPGTDAHGYEFMIEMKALCPPEYWHYELDYKKHSASIAGISKEHAHKAVEIKCMNLMDLL